jgi:hypothetical protein
MLIEMESHIVSYFGDFYIFLINSRRNLQINLYVDKNHFDGLIYNSHSYNV